MSEPGIGERIHYRASDEQRQDIIDKSTGKSAGSCDNNHHDNIHISALHCKIGCGRDYHFRRERYERAFYHHENEHKQIGSIIHEPVKKRGSVEILGYGTGYE